MITIEPPHPSGGQIVGKTLIGLIVGFLLSFLVFATVSAMGTGFFEDGSGLFLALVMLLLACIITLVGNITLAGILNLVFSSDYYDFGKMVGSGVLLNGILVVLFAPIYISMSGNMIMLLRTLAFHTMFGFFVSYSLIELVTNPNYAISHLIGTSTGFALSLLIYAIFARMMSDVSGSSTFILIMLLPFVVSYTVIPLCHGVRSGIYYSIFTTGSNPFYIASLSEVEQTEQENTINVQVS